MQAIYTELLHSTRLYAIKKEKRPTTGLVKVICLAFDRKAFNDHGKKKSSAPSRDFVLGGSSWTATLFVRFLAAWMPLLVEAIRSRTFLDSNVTCRRAQLPVLQVPQVLARQYRPRGS